MLHVALQLEARGGNVNSMVMQPAAAALLSMSVVDNDWSPVMLSMKIKHYWASSTLAMLPFRTKLHVASWQSGAKPRQQQSIGNCVASA